MYIMVVCQQLTTMFIHSAFTVTHVERFKGPHSNTCLCSLTINALLCMYIPPHRLKEISVQRFCKCAIICGCVGTMCDLWSADKTRSQHKISVVL